MCRIRAGLRILPMDIDGIDLRVEGDGTETVLMVHGWPDTLRLWDGSVEALKPDWG